MFIRYGYEGIFVGECYGIINCMYVTCMHALSNNKNSNLLAVMMPTGLCGSGHISISMYAYMHVRTYICMYTCMYITFLHIRTKAQAVLHN